jgi:hypothetical protein
MDGRSARIGCGAADATDRTTGTAGGERQRHTRRGTDDTGTSGHPNHLPASVRPQPPAWCAGRSPANATTLQRNRDRQTSWLGWPPRRSITREPHRTPVEGTPAARQACSLQAPDRAARLQQVRQANRRARGGQQLRPTPPLRRRRCTRETGMQSRTKGGRPTRNVHGNGKTGERQTTCSIRPAVRACCGRRLNTGPPARLPHLCATASRMAEFSTGLDTRERGGLSQEALGLECEPHRRRSAFCY